MLNNTRGKLIKKKECKKLMILKFNLSKFHFFKKELSVAFEMNIQEVYKKNIKNEDNFKKLKINGIKA